MLQKSIWGWITLAVKRYAKANNIYKRDQCNPDDTSTYLQYFDANNLYGRVMIQKLPIHRFAWEKKTNDFTPEKVDKMVEKDKKGCTLKIDVDYLKELHQKHNEPPILVERMKFGKVQKLVANFKYKKTYVVHIKILLKQWSMDRNWKHYVGLLELNKVVGWSLYHAKY